MTKMNKDNKKRKGIRRSQTRGDIQTAFECTNI